MKDNDTLYDLLIEIKSELQAANARIQAHIEMDKMLFDSHAKDIAENTKAVASLRADKEQNKGMRVVGKYVLTFCIAVIPTAAYAIAHYLGFDAAGK